MQAAGWSRIKELALEALDCEPQEREAFLGGACAGDSGLRAEVERLIEAMAAADQKEFLESPPVSPGVFSVGTAGLAGPGPGALVGTRLGHYRVRRLIGVGGMGAVYEAVQEQPRRTVALKVMRAGLSSRSALRRFEYESQLLARLRHPGIAQVFEAGAHEGPEGPVPYFAMEYIPGARPVTVFSKEKRLSLRERLELMARVCEAVHHGHQKGIVHRDLKPSNILVDSSGHPKIIDFGVARATDSDLAVTTLQTGVGQLIGTLQYMSPEQCVADPADIDTRSDVYSLGVVLFELLTSRPPYDISKVPVYEAPRIIREQSPERPSAIDASLRGDIQIIVLKALEKDRAQRYQSAAELGLDLRRYLAGEAIAARPPSVIYQLRVMATRHRTLVASVAAVVLALTTGAVVAMLGLQRAIQARDLAQAAAKEARAQAARAERIVTFLKGTIGSVDPSLASAPTTGLIAAMDPDYSPWELRRQSSWEYAGRFGQTPSAIDLLRGAAKRMEQTFPDDPSIRGELSALIGATLGQLGAWTDAATLLRSAVELQRRTLGDTHETTISTMLELGGAQTILGHFAEAEEELREACEACRKAFGPVDPRTLQAIRVRTANLMSLPTRRDESLRLIDDTIEAVSRRLGPEDALAWIMTSHKASLLEQAGQLPEAETAARRAVEGFRAGGMDRRAAMDAVATLAHILRTRGAPGSLTEAERLQRSVIAFYDARISPDYGGTVELRKVEIELLLLLDRPAEAESQARIILEGHQRLYGPDSLNTFKSQARLARVLLAEGVKLEEAENLARVAAERTPKITSPTEDYAVYHAATLADARRARGGPVEGLSECERLIAITGGPETGNAGWTAAYVRGVQGRCLTDLGRFDDAAAAFDLAMKNAERWGDPASVIRITAIRSAAAMCDKAARTEAAARWRAMLPPP